MVAFAPRSRTCRSSSSRCSMAARTRARILEKRSVDEMLRFQFTPSSKPGNIDLKEENAGLFWSTKFNVTRVGHGGSDPGIKTEMLANLSKDVGVIVFTNT